MIITATDFQLRVNEYFTKLIQGEEVIIERYGKKFAVLLSFEEYNKLIQQAQKNKTQPSTPKISTEKNTQNSEEQVTPSAKFESQSAHMQSQEQTSRNSTKQQMPASQKMTSITNHTVAEQQPLASDTQEYQSQTSAGQDSLLNKQQKQTLSSSDSLTAQELLKLIKILLQQG